MKRTLHVLLAVLMITSVVGTAEGKPKGKGKKKKQATNGQVSAAQSGGAIPASAIDREKKEADSEPVTVVPKPGPISFGPPVELLMKRAQGRRFDLRSLPRTPPVQQERVELPEPPFHPVAVEGTVNGQSTPIRTPVPLVQAPPPI